MGRFGGEFRGFWGGVVRDPGAKIGRQAAGGGADFAASAGARRSASPAVRAPRLFLARRGVGRDLGGAGFSFPGKQRSGFNRRDLKDPDDCFLGYLYV